MINPKHAAPYSSKALSLATALAKVEPTTNFRTIKTYCSALHDCMRAGAAESVEALCDDIRKLVDTAMTGERFGKASQQIAKDLKVAVQKAENVAVRNCSEAGKR